MELLEQELDTVTVEVTATETPEKVVPELSGDEQEGGSQARPLSRKNWARRRTSNRNLILLTAAAVESRLRNLVKVSFVQQLISHNLEGGKLKHFIYVSLREC